MRERERERESKYQDFVIKDGRFVGKFEEMYQKISDPWKLLEKNKSGLNLNYQVILNYCEQIRFSKTKTLEIGCGYPQISYELYKKKFTVYGTDISKTVIEKSKKKYPELKNNLYRSNFLNFSLYEKIKPDIIILSDISWYVLPELKKFIVWYKNLKKKTYLIHSLAIYGKKKQKYGKGYFYDLNTIKSYFKLNYLSSGYIENIDSDCHTFFLGVNK
jgi:SAM-dependent methyltransferase